MENNIPLTIKVHDYNIAARDPEFVRTLRLLTLNPYSGMNYELNNFAQIRLERDVDCKIITAYHENEFVGWALLSGETTDFQFMNAADGFDDSKGLLFQVYVQPGWRRKGVASQILEVANKQASGKTLCVCPWDEASGNFYNKHDHYQTKQL